MATVSVAEISAPNAAASKNCNPYPGEFTRTLWYIAETADAKEVDEESGDHGGDEGAQHGVHQGAAQVGHERFLHDKQ